MECLRAQELVSAALDEWTTDPTELRSAKEHCRTCPECGTLVRTLLAVRQAGTPMPPDDLVDRVMARVRAESIHAQQAETPRDNTPEPAFPSPETVPSEQPARTWQELYERALAPRNRRALVAWSTAAAVLFVAAGIGARAGVRAILVPKQAVETMVAGDEYRGAAESADLSASDGAAVEGSAPAASADARFLTVDTNVYRFTAVAGNVDEDALETVGESRTALDGSGRAKTLDVLGTDGSTRVYVPDEDNQLLAFDPVTRTYAGRPYALQSAPIERFGEWPTLPSGLRRPTSSDGSPTFEESEPDDSGVTVFTLKGSTAASGIAFPPNQPAGDPLAGSPEWSWWVPVK